MSEQNLLSLYGTREDRGCLTFIVGIATGDLLARGIAAAEIYTALEGDVVEVGARRSRGADPFRAALLRVN